MPLQKGIQMDLLLAFILFMAVMLAALIKGFTMVIALLAGLVAFTAVGLKRGFGVKWVQAELTTLSSSLRSCVSSDF